jgi:hypothetical protein
MKIFVDSLSPQALGRQQLVTHSLLKFYSVPPRKCRDNTSMMPQPLPSKSFPIHHSPIILLFDAIRSSCWHRRSRNHTEKLQISSHCLILWHMLLKLKLCCITQPSIRRPASVNEFLVVFHGLSRRLQGQ